MVGRKNKENLLFIASQFLHAIFQSEGDGGGRVPAFGLKDNMFYFSKVGFDIEFVVAVGHYDDVIKRKHPQKPFYGLPQKGLIPGELKKLLGEVAPAERPEPGTGTTCKNEGFHVIGLLEFVWSF